MTLSKNIFLSLILVTGLMNNTSHALEHPGCADEDIPNIACEAYLILIHQKEKACYRIMEFKPNGDSSYLITCELLPNDKSNITYTFTQDPNDSSRYSLF